MKKILCNIFFLLILVFSLSSCLDSGVFTATRAHYTPNFREKRFHIDAGIARAAGVSVNAGVAVSKKWAVVGSFYGNIAQLSTQASQLNVLGAPIIYDVRKKGYATDIGANFRIKGRKNLGFQMSSGVGINDSECQSISKYSYEYNASKGFYWYLQPYMTGKLSEKIRYQFSYRFQNQLFNLNGEAFQSSNSSPISYAGRRSLAYHSLAMGIDISLYKQLSLGLQIGTEFSSNISLNNSRRSYDNSGWGKIGVQFAF